MCVMGGGGVCRGRKLQKYFCHLATFVLSLLKGKVKEGAWHNVTHSILFSFCRPGKSYGSVSLLRIILGLFSNVVSRFVFAGLWLVSGSSDNTLQVFQVENETKVATISEDHSSYSAHDPSLAITSCGSTVASVCGEKVR